MKTTILLPSILLLFFTISLILKKITRRKRLAIGENVALHFGLTYQQNSVTSKIYYQASGFIAGYNTEISAVKVSKDDLATFVYVYFNKLEQRKVDKILLSIQDGSILASNSEIYIITGGLRLKIFGVDLDPGFYTEAITLLINTCKKFECH